MSSQARDSGQPERILQPDTGNSTEVKKPCSDRAARAWGSYYKRKGTGSNIATVTDTRHGGSHVHGGLTDTFSQGISLQQGSKL